MHLAYFHVDAFTSAAFGGNAAGVCPLEEWLPDEQMQRRAAEHNLAETAFLVSRGSGAYDLRWFSPTIEVDLCGHATLAAAHVLWRHRGEKTEKLTFHTRSGPLAVTQDRTRIVLDFPSRPATPGPLPADAALALGATPQSCGKARDLLLVFKSEAQVRGLRPDAARILAWDAFAVIATAPGTDCDFVSRFFAPRAGILEDSATGSSHCTLTPYWSARLGKSKMHARQLSVRGGEFFCELADDRVRIGGHAVTYFTATLAC